MTKDMPHNKIVPKRQFSINVVTHHLLVLDGAGLLLLCGRVELGRGEGDDRVGVVVRLHRDPRRVDALGPST